MWKVVAASVVGTSHIRAGLPCQDAHNWLKIREGNDDYLLITVADGAGSASYSHIGASEAVQHLATIIRPSICDLNSVTKEKAREWMVEVLEHLQKVATKENIALNQLASTLLLAIISPHVACFGQIGDGGWVVERNGELIPGTWPQNGEFANITTFLTSESALDSFQWERIEGEISAAAGFTDGLQSLVLNYSSQKAHAPFFIPMFSAVRESEDDSSLIAPLQTFLNSEYINSRTDDDKTLVLACWRIPVLKSDGIG